MTNYHRITFAPVQGFIQKSRKLRDLDGSSLILSFLAGSICKPYDKAGQLILPATIDIARGVPNQIVIKGEVSESEIRKLFDTAWRAIVKTCQKYIEERIEDRFPGTEFDWNQEWNYCCKYSWELFYASGKDFDAAKEAIASRKQSRNWIGVNWTGESSSLSGADAIAWNQMCSHKPTNSIPRAEIDEFYKKLKAALPETIIDKRERLSIPELIKRLITLSDVRKLLMQNYSNLPDIEELETFRYLNRLKLDREKPEPSQWTGWFMGDGDRAGTYLDWVRDAASAAGTDTDAEIYNFSKSMANWSADLQSQIPVTIPRVYDGRIVYAGGDDFLGVLYRNTPDDPLQLSECFERFWYRFPEIWRKHGQEKLTVSVGFVWADPQIPQRDVLQHCRLAEKSAKGAGRDRLAIRILFKNGNHLEWCCPWWCLEKILTSYRDRDGGKNWTHFHDDVAKLDSRHSINSHSSEIAVAIFEIYFGANTWQEISNRFWNDEEPDDEETNYFSQNHSLAGILGKRPKTLTAENERINNWVVSLSQVGFQIFANWS
jgi:CRISPR-associated protein Cmr2